MLEFIDTHTHFYDEAFDNDVDEVISRAKQNGIIKMIQPDIDTKERNKMLELTTKYPGTLYNMLGFYPGSVDLNWEKEIEALYSCVNKTNCVAIGEIGLDYHYGKDFSEEQKKVLGLQFELASSLNLPVNIHLRDATEDFINIVKEHKHLGLRGNLHAFNESYETFMSLQKYGNWSVGIGGVITFKNSKLSEIVRKIPMDNILLETDSPYLTPTPYRGKRNESSYIPLIAQKIADTKGISIEEVAHITTMNAFNLFKI